MWYRSLGPKLIFSVGFATILVIGVFAYLNVHIQREQLIGEVMRLSERRADFKRVTGVLRGMLG